MKQSTNEVRKKFIEYYIKKEHEHVPSSPLIPENDPTTLFTGSGMQPMLPYLLGEKYPSGATRIVDSQKSFRAVDIEDVGDNRHTTFFEMLGNWSFGDYWKEEQLEWVFSFFVNELKLDPKKLYVTVFDGDKDNNLPKDEEAVGIWKKLFSKYGIDAKVGERIFFYDAVKNWWSRSGVPNDMPIGEPGGPDSEIFYKFDVEHDPAYGDLCHPNCDCGRFMEIANSVFMEYKKIDDNTFEKLPQRNVDFGGGLERIVAAIQNDPDVFKIDIFDKPIQLLEGSTKVKYEGKNKHYMRVIADHMRGATFMLSEGILPSNKLQGYILRRLIRRSAVMMYFLSGNVDVASLIEVCSHYYKYYKEIYFQNTDFEYLSLNVRTELEKFNKLLNKGIKEIDKKPENELTPSFVFDLYQTYGFPFEITAEILNTKGIKVDEQVFFEAKKKHSELSKTSTKGAFKGGLGEISEKTVWYHTLTHLLHASLRKVLGESVSQAGSNITPERLRFDYTFNRPMSQDEIKEVEFLVNSKKDENLPVSMSSLRIDEALSSGALAFFKEKYANIVNVYSIGDYSKEVCGGPHVKNTKEIKGVFKILKEQSLGQGVRRIKAIVE